MKVTINGEDRLFYVHSDVTSLSVISDLYSAWKLWWVESDNAKYVQAFRTFGGDPTNVDETQFAPQYFFLMNDWKVHVDGINVVVQNNLYTDDGSSPFVVVNGGSVSNRNSDAQVIVTNVEQSMMDMMEQMLLYKNEIISSIETERDTLIGEFDDISQELEDAKQLISLKIDDIDCTDANIVSVNGVSVTSVDDFKADVSNLDVDLSTIPQSVWEYASRELTVAAGLTPEQQALLDQILLEVQDIECSGGGTVTGNEWVVTI